MTVKELIEILSQYDSAVKVCVLFHPGDPDLEDLDLDDIVLVEQHPNGSIVIR